MNVNDIISHSLEVKANVKSFYELESELGNNIKTIDFASNWLNKIKTNKAPSHVAWFGF
jgi:hypothetical protein